MRSNKKKSAATSFALIGVYRVPQLAMAQLCRWLEPGYQFDYNLFIPADEYRSLTPSVSSAESVAEEAPPVKEIDLAEAFAEKVGQGGPQHVALPFRSPQKTLMQILGDCPYVVLPTHPDW